jgi:hypothetical protein
VELQREDGHGREIKGGRFYSEADALESLVSIRLMA